jgi:chromosome segregation ATPase
MSQRGSFEDRVFARFDSIDDHFRSVETCLQAVETRFQSLEVHAQSVDGRLQSLEGQIERRSFETKPIWERALAEIGAVKERLGVVEGRLGSLEDLSKQILRKLNIVNNDMLTFRADQLGLETRIEKLEPASPV